ncbi:hypothetical protein ACFQ8S_00005, partial [Streptomyces virginiae]|uniref:hypothetical protein n=1 Tax=Streptomyces virginiae TaxID=1961 RepID=UPI0036CC437E
MCVPKMEAGDAADPDEQRGVPRLERLSNSDGIAGAGVGLPSKKRSNYRGFSLTALGAPAARLF